MMKVSVGGVTGELNLTACGGEVEARFHRVSARLEEVSVRVGTNSPWLILNPEQADALGQALRRPLGLRGCHDERDQVSRQAAR